MLIEDGGEQAYEENLLLTGYSADRLTGGTASASSTGGANAAANAVDNNTGTGWLSSGLGSAGLNEYWRYQFAAPVEIRRVTVRNSGGFRTADSLPSEMTLQYSDDGSAWSTAQVLTIANSTALQTFDITVARGVHLYWQHLLTGDAIGGSGGFSYALEELEMMEGVYG